MPRVRTTTKPRRATKGEPNLAGLLANPLVLRLDAPDEEPEDLEETIARLAPPDLDDNA